MVPAELDMSKFYKILFPLNVKFVPDSDMLEFGM